MTDTVQLHCTRPWYMRPLVWVLGAILAGLAVFGIVHMIHGPAALPYGEFLDQLDAGNVASVSFSGTQIDGHFKQQVTESQANNKASPTAFRSRVPAFGDPTLLPKLRDEHVAISVASSQWLEVGGIAILGTLGAFLLAKPMLLVIAAAFVAGFVRVARGGKMDVHSILSVLPMFRSPSAQRGKQNESVTNSVREGDQSAPRKNEMPDAVQHHHKRAWYLRPPVWVLGVVLLGLAAFGLVEIVNRPPVVPYGDFLAQLDADNVASVTFKGTEIDGNFKHPVEQAATNSAAPQTAFRSQVPDFGDPTLLPELRKEHVVIDVVSSSNWVSWLGRLPWPMVLIIAGVLIAGLVRLLRGGKAPEDSAEAVHQMPMMRLMSGLFGKQDPLPTPSRGGEAPPKA